jgi:Dockerin type I domain
MSHTLKSEKSSVYNRIAYPPLDQGMSAMLFSATFHSVYERSFPMFSRKSWLNKLSRFLFGSSQPIRSYERRRNRPHVEHLEDRITPATISWNTWTSNQLGTMMVGSTPVTATFAAGLNDPYSANPGYPSYTPSSTYADGNVVSNAPSPTNGIMGLNGGNQNVNTLTFSTPVVNPVMAIWSLGGLGVTASFVFTNATPTLIAGGPSAEYGGSAIAVNGNVVSGQEGNGTVEFIGTYSTISWTNPQYESWYGFNVGASLPGITSVKINQDISALYNAAGQPSAGVQRSMVDDVVYTFSEPVAITSSSTEPNVFTIAYAPGFTGTGLPALNWTAVAGSNNTQWAVTFNGPNTQGGSILNGEYVITVNDPTAILAVADSQQLSLASSGIGSATQSFYRLYGDINGDEFVNAADNVKFKQALTTYNAAFDYNSDGFVNASDNVRFKQDLTVNFTGFTPTI